MNGDTGASNLHATLKKIICNFLENRKMAGVIIGVYNGSAVVINEQLTIPMNMVKGNLKSKLVSGYKVVLLRNDGGKEYYLLEISGKPYLINTGE